MREIVHFSPTCYFDFTGYYLHRDGQEDLNINGYKYNLLRKFAESPHRGFSRDELETCNPHYDPAIDTAGRSVDTQISSLRGYDGAIKEQISSVRGIGYKYTGARLISIAEEETPKENVREGETQKTTGKNATDKRAELATSDRAIKSVNEHAAIKGQKTYDTQAQSSLDGYVSLRELMCELFEKSLSEIIKARTPEEVTGLANGIHKHYPAISKEMLRDIFEIVTKYDVILDIGRVIVLEEARIFITELYYKLLVYKLEVEIGEMKNELERARTALDGDNINKLQIKISEHEAWLEESETILASLQSSNSMKRP